MANQDGVVWGIHAGKHGVADALFLNKQCIALGWNEVSDLSHLPDDRESYKTKIAEVYPDIKEGAIPNWAGQLFRFVHEMKIGDIIVYPSKIDRQMHIGKVEGDYQYSPAVSSDYPHIRKVKWIVAVPRTKFPQGALYETGSAMTLFQIRNYAEPFLSALEGKTSSPSPTTDDAHTISMVTEEIEQNTRDFILKQLAQELKGHAFAHFVAHLLGAMGYRCRVSPEGPDGGIDIIAHKDELGFEPPMIKVQVKSTEGTITDPMVSALYGKVGPNEYGLLVTLGSFTPPAKTFGRSKTNLRLIDGEELVDLILEHYEQFDSGYKGFLPLKRVYVPEVLKDAEEKI
jgi:restriction system protein